MAIKSFIMLHYTTLYSKKKKKNLSSGFILKSKELITPQAQPYLEAQNHN